ncbi:hypothetical protein [Isoptericola sp. NPDC056573]|uniref:hypothetical protein n=1 Tax=unclassified Isoptericola TaxID=2623355 RepID=UPI003692B499
MRFLDTILKDDLAARRFLAEVRREGLGIGAYRPVDVAFFGPMVFFNGFHEEI